jgi:hypothetical protein
MYEGIQASRKLITLEPILHVYQEKAVVLGHSLLFLVKRRFTWRTPYMG